MRIVDNYIIHYELINYGMVHFIIISLHCLHRHINGPRTVESAREQDMQYVQQEDVQQTIIADQTTQVVTSHTGGINFIGQDDTGNPIDIHLVCKLLLSPQSKSFEFRSNDQTF